MSTQLTIRLSEEIREKLFTESLTSENSMQKLVVTAVEEWIERGFVPTPHSNNAGLATWLRMCEKYYNRSIVAEITILSTYLQSQLRLYGRDKAKKKKRAIAEPLQPSAYVMPSDFSID